MQNVVSVLLWCLLLCCISIQLVFSIPTNQLILQVKENFENDGENLAPSPSLESVIARLLFAIQNAQAFETVDYAPRNSYPPLKHWYRQRGIYDSFVHLNFHGEFPSRSLLRNGYRFPDDNAFVTLFITHALLETAELVPDAPAILNGSLLNAIEAVSFQLKS